LYDVVGQRGDFSGQNLDSHYYPKPPDRHGSVGAQHTSLRAMCQVARDEVVRLHSVPIAWRTQKIRIGINF
jgi:hypothetical protein